MNILESKKWLGLTRKEICQNLSNEQVTHFANMTHVASLKMVFQFKKQCCTHVWLLQL